MPPAAPSSLPPDLPVPPDLPIPTDLSVPTDLPAPTNLPAPADLPAPTDVPVPTDLAADLDTLTITRRGFLRTATIAASGLAAGSTGTALAQQTKPNAQDAVTLPQLHAPTEAREKIPGPFLPPSKRVGFAIVGLGHLSLEQILPAFGRSKYCKPTALVSGDPAKAQKIAAQYGIPTTSLYTYQTYEQIAQNPDVEVIYIVLPNSMHREFVDRGSKTGKHILCEKPMSISSRDCEHMIAACKSAHVKLMIAYRQQYEPMNRDIVKMVRSGKLGNLKSFIATNAQDQGDPNQWRQKIALAGGGCLPDVGIYCLNAARFLTGLEPTEVFGATFQPKDDPRFTQVEETCSFTLRFPDGFLATCSSGYGAHRSQFFRLEGDRAWAELSPAFAYHGLKLKTSRTEDGRDVVSEPSIEEKDQFALEMDHMALCVRNNTQPHTPGEEGLQDQRLVEAIYESARTGKTVRVPPPTTPTRGPDPTEAS